MKNWFKSALVALALLASVTANAQKNDVLMTIGDEKVTKQEFEAVFKKNNSRMTSAPDEKTVNEYLDLYTNFRLKVKEAKSLGMDTIGSFKRELYGYRKQLAAPYLTDKEVTEKLINEAWERSQKEIHASHILITCKQDASPKDTLAAYNKIMAIRKRIVDKKEDFGKVASETSDDPGAKDNKGDLGFFSAFSMVYPFETVCYNLKPGTVSMPVRTSFGYHLVKVWEVRPAQGEVKASHIMLRLSPKSTKADSANAKAQINEIYSKLQAGERFEDLAIHYSDDKGSAKAGGVLPVFGTGKMVPEFENETFALKKPGDYSKPFMTSYGWHIVKLLERKNPPTFEEAKNDLKNKIARDSRAELNKKSFINKLKKEYNYSFNQKALDVFYKKSDTTLYAGKFQVAEAANPKDVLFTFAGKNYLVSDFAEYAEDAQKNFFRNGVENLRKDMFENYSNKVINEYEEDRLDAKYPEFKTLMEEYRDGILLFELTDEKVWSAAVKDSAGIERFYQQNKKSYMWGERLDAKIYTMANEDVAKEVRKLIKNKKIYEDSLLRRVNAGNPLNLTIKHEKFERGDNAIIDGIAWKKGITSDQKINNTVVFVQVKEKIAPTAKSLSEIRGAVTADYQNYLEKQWLDELKAKYPVKLNQEVLKTVLK